MKTLKCSITIMVTLAFFTGTSSFAFQYSPTNIPVKTGPGDQSEASIAIDPNNPNHLFVTYDDSYGTPYSMPGYTFSTDGGNTWSQGQQIAPQNSYYGFNPSCGEILRKRESRRGLTLS